MLYLGTGRKPSLLTFPGRDGKDTLYSTKIGRKRMNEEPSRRTALITGASRGLGLALARALAEDDWTLIIDARGEEALESARSELSRDTSIIAIPGDVSDP